MIKKERKKEESETVDKRNWIAKEIWRIVGTITIAETTNIIIIISAIKKKKRVIKTKIK